MEETLGADNYWDWVSSQDLITPEDKEDIRTLIKDCFDFVKPYLDELMWVEANIIYLNYVHDVPQSTIANLIGITQLGVSKRLHSGIRKLKIVISRPTKDSREVLSFLRGFFSERDCNILLQYYFFKTYSLTSVMCGMSITGVRDIVLNCVKNMESLLNLQSGDRNLFIRELKKCRGVEFTPNSHINKETLDLISRIEDGELQEIKVTLDKYYTYLSMLTNCNSFGDYLFKRDEKVRSNAKLKTHKL